MSYLLDRKAKRKKNWVIAWSIFGLLVLFFFRTVVFGGMSFLGVEVFRPVLVFGNNVGENFSKLGAYFSSKKTLIQENRTLRLEVAENDALLESFNPVLEENILLKETLGRREEGRKLKLATILSKPNQSAYDTLLLDQGSNAGIELGKMVLAFGQVPIGRIAEVSPNTSKVILFSSADERTNSVLSRAGGEEALAGNIFYDLVGRGGGNFEIILPREVLFGEGDQAVLPGIRPRVVAVAEKTISDPRDPFKKVLLVSPVNIFELKFVEIEIE